MNLSWQEAYEERAAIMEFDAHLPRKEAEAKARRSTAPPSPPPGRNSPQYQAFQEYWHSPATTNRS
jgi:hypothetical protein